MPRSESPLRGEMVQGTLDMLVLQTLLLGPAHGHTIAHAIERRSEDVLQVEHGSLYPALYRLENRGWIASFQGTSENNRKARYYRLTPEGKKQLSEQALRWEELVQAIGRVMKPVTEFSPLSGLQARKSRPNSAPAAVRCGARPASAPGPRPRQPAPSQRGVSGLANGGVRARPLKNATTRATFW